MITNSEFFFKKIKNKEPFALVRFGDGEYQVINKKRWKMGKFSNVNAEFTFDPNDSFDRNLAHQLLESLVYVDDNYYIGLPILMSRTIFKFFKELVRTNEEYLTILNIFTGDRETRKAMPLFFDFLFDMVENSDMKINWICPREVRELSPSFINKFWFLRKNAWHVQYDEILSSLLEYIDDKKGELFMFSAGPFSEILIHKAWLKNKNDIYVDVGCIFDPFIFEKVTRNYYWKVNDELEKRRKILEKYTKQKPKKHSYGR